MKLNFLFLIMAMTLQSCLFEAEESTELSFSELSDRAGSINAFKDTVHPLLKASCAGCHGDGGTQAPKHAVSDPAMAHDAVVDTGRVNFLNTESSRLVKRLSEDNHYCWSDCQQNAATMLAAIEEWKASSGGIGGVSGKTTGALKISDATQRVAETINGTLVLQAEDGDLSGRFKVKVASQASGLRYISGDGPGVHPIESTLRGSEVVSACNPESNINNTVFGPYRISERKRHVNQSGYVPYSSRVVITWIDPTLRNDYEAALKDPNVTDYSPYYYQDENSDFIRVNSVRVMPDFMDKPDFDPIKNISEPANTAPTATYTFNGQTNLVFDYFKPRFGTSGTEFFFANANEVITGLPGYRWEPVFNDMNNRIRNIFENANNVGDVPVSMRSIPDPNNPGQNLNFDPEVAAHVDIFHSYFMDGMTAATAQEDTDQDGIRTMDRFFHYEVPVASRVTYRNVQALGAVINLDNDFGFVNLDLSELYTGGSTKTISQIRAETYNTTLKPVFTGANCINCHGDGSNRPQYATADAETAYNAAASINGFINFENPSNARPVERVMVERHNCGTNAACDALGASMITAFGAWEAAIETELQAQANSQETGLEALTLAERTPGKAEYPFRVTEAGQYNVWVKLMAPTNNIDRLRIRIKDAEGNYIRSCPVSSNGICTENTASQAICRTFNPNERNWEWFTQYLGSNENDLIEWSLSPGLYTLEIFEHHIDVKIDLIAINKNPEFNPAANLIDEGFIQDLRPQTLRYDLAGLLDGGGFFEIDVKPSSTQDAYVFRNPRFVDGTKNIRFRNIKVLVNGSYELSNSTYSQLDRVTLPNSGILTYSPLVVLEVAGPSNDEFAFVFEDLQSTDLPASPLDEDAPVPVEGRECLELALFEQSVMPILNQIRLIAKQDYMDYTRFEFPGTNGNTATNETFYTCTTCHNEEHPYFKMTTFFNNSEVLCEQALSRVDFGNFERSLLLRGINGTFNHPKLHFIQDVQMTGSGANRRFVEDSSDASGLASTWRGNRLLKYTVGTDSSAGEINLNAYSGGEREYLEKFIGTYQRVRYLTYQNVQSPDDGEVLTENGSTSINNQGFEIYNQSGRSVYEILSPEEYVNNQGAWNPNNPTEEGPIAVNRDCMGVAFNNVNGTIVDPSPCGQSGNYATEFENIKTKYREAVINWMAREKQAYDQLQN